MTKTKKVAKRRKGQSASEAMLGLAKAFEENAKWYRSKGFMNNDELNVAVRAACERTLLACAREIKRAIKQT